MVVFYKYAFGFNFMRMSDQLVLQFNHVLFTKMNMSWSVYRLMLFSRMLKAYIKKNFTLGLSFFPPDLPYHIGMG